MRTRPSSTSPALDEHVAAQIADQFAALSDTSRVRIVAALLDGEQRVSAIVAQVGLSQPVVSHHLRVLRQLRLVRAR
jgi:DNA-binding transcriptional ArsR family regulator